MRQRQLCERNMWPLPTHVNMSAKRTSEANWRPGDDSVVCKQAAGLCVEEMNKESSLSSGREKAA